MPTETVYGLAANALDPLACTAVYALKGRPADNPLIVHVWDLGHAQTLARTDSRAEQLAGDFWPGPLTLVLERKDGLGTVALRAPVHPVARQLIWLSERPLAAPSANLSGRPSPTTAQHVAEDLGGTPVLILDGGPSAFGLESTVVDLTKNPAAILRPGAVSAEALAAYGVEASASGSRPPSPGTRYRHYRPRVPLVVLVDGARGRAADALGPWARDLSSRGEVVACLAVGAGLPEGVLGRSFPSVEAMATGLFAAFRELENEASVIVVAAPGAEGLGRAIRDRLWRAAGGVFRTAGEPVQPELERGD